MAVIGKAEAKKFGPLRHFEQGNKWGPPLLRTPPWPVASWHPSSSKAVTASQPFYTYLRYLTS